ncbi:MAG: fructosamine kinase family protein [Cytophagales bacterium]|nr:fructosamine kinase family protein [Bernardetiaceae bacterium]MDW8211018.1 fructosamine kinase family protein [Cytophagales bacterium]
MFSADAQNQFFESALLEATGWEHQILDMNFLHGGCINNAVKLQTNYGKYFLKFNEMASAYEMFQAEARGLEMLAATHTLTVPRVIGAGKQHGKSYLLLEYFEPIPPQRNYWEQLGQGLAALHSHRQQMFGLDFNNYIGSLPQNNEWIDDGINFFIEKRLRVQAGLAYYNQLIDEPFLKRLDKLYQKLPDLIPKESASLLHGDLWGGNVIVGHQGEPCLIDPAVYFGFREAEMAQTQLFGGFHQRFYQAYREAMPLESGFQERVPIYNLYPLLVHLNLFGLAYLSAIEQTLKRFI